MAAKTVALQKGEGSAFWILNGLYEIKVSSVESGGAVTVMEMTIPAGWGPPPHTHDGAETAYVISGKVRFHIGEETVEAGPGAFVHIPEGTWERPEILETAHLLMTYVPGGIDEFFAEVGVPATAHTLPPLSEEPPDLEQFVAVGARHGLQMRPMPEG